MIHSLRELAARLRGLFGDRRADKQLDDEIEAHLQLLTDRYVRQGMTRTKPHGPRAASSETSH